MNQDSNNLNPNNFSTQCNNGMPNNQSLNNPFNPNVGSNINVSGQTFNSQPTVETISQGQPQLTSRVQQPIMQEPIPQPMNLFENANTSNQNFNSKPSKKMNLGLIIGIVVMVMVIGIIVGLVFINKNNINKEINIIYDETGAMLFRIEDVFIITGRGTVVTGTVERGSIKMNDQVQIIGLDKEIISTIVTDVEVIDSDLAQATVGDDATILLRGVTSDQVHVGQVLAAPNSIDAIKKFDANLSVISTENGGRSTPFFDEYSPQFYFKTEVKGKIKLPKGKEMVKPGEEVSVTVSLTTSIAMDVGTKFFIREGGRTVANGVVTKVY